MKQRISHQTNSRLWQMILAVAIITMSITKAYSQQQQPSFITEKTDSIVALLPQLSGVDKLNAIAEIININENLPADKHFTKMYLEEARKQNQIVAQGKALQRLTSQYHSQYDTDSIFIFGEEAIRFCREHKLYDYLFTAQASIIRRYVRDGKIITAIRKAEEAYSEAKDLNENFTIGTLLSTLAEIYNNIGQYEEAIRYWTEGIVYFKKAETDEDIFGICTVYYFISCLYIYLNQPEIALQYADSMQARIDRNLRVQPVFYNAQRDNFYKENQRAIAYAKLNRPELAMQAILRAEEVFDPQWNEISGYYAVQFDEMWGAYEHAMKNYDKALTHISRLLAYFEKSKNEDGIEIAKKDMAQIYFDKGDYQSAAEIRLQIYQRKEEMNKESVYAQINELRTLMALDKSEMESERRLAAIRQQRTMITGLGGACIALIVIVALVVWNRRRIALKNKGLYLRIKAQDQLEEALEQERKKNRNLRMQTESSPIEPTEKTPEDERFEKLTALMKQEQLFTNCNLKRSDLAAKIGLSDRGLHDCLKNNIGMSFMEYINHLRLTYARELIATAGRKLTIEAIAAESGFNSRITFWRLFQEKYSLTPEEFKKIAGKS